MSPSRQDAASRPPPPRGAADRASAVDNDDHNEHGNGSGMPSTTTTPATRRDNPTRAYTDPGLGGSAHGSGAQPRASGPPADTTSLAGPAAQSKMRTATASVPPASSSVAGLDDATKAGATSATTSVGDAKESMWQRFGAGRSPGSSSTKKRRRAAIHWKERARDNVAAAYESIVIQGILRRKPLPPTKDGRHILLDPSGQGPSHILDERTEKPYISNFIRSSRYTVYDFIPKQLIFQFSKLGNFYFLVTGIIQTIPGLSTVGRWTTIAPLAVFVAFSMAKEGWDDYRRYQLDKSENRSQTVVLNQGDSVQRRKDRLRLMAEKVKSRVEKKKADVEEVALQDLDAPSDDAGDWTSLEWQDVRVGDVVRLRRDEGVPADIVLLHATGPNGIAYIETMALDGETNLKAKQACPLLMEKCSTVNDLRETQATIVSEDPNINLYSYDGKVTVDGETLPLSVSNVVYRGSKVRNTTEAYGLVINSGEECKIRMNAHKNVRTKKPAMQSIINKIILFQIFIVLMLTAGLTIGYYLWEESSLSMSFYLFRRGVYDASVPFKEIFFGYLIMFNTLIPLSLYISLEIVKIGQLLLLQDAEMYDPVTDTPMVANTTTILENLGQVNYVFSDKTGTLTENLMRFRKLSVAGVACLHDLDIMRDDEAKRHKAESSKPSDKLGKQIAEVFEVADRAQQMAGRTSTGSMVHWKSSVRPNEEPEMKTEELLDYIRRRPNTVFSRKAKHFILCIALCHTCLPEHKEDGTINFQAASPDELALVEAAQDLGYLLIDRPAQSIKLQTRDANGTEQLETYQVLDVIEFSSKRKRMTIIIRMPDNSICVVCKGADNVITSRLRLSHLAEQKVRDIGHRASMRKTFEQNKAIQRISMQVSGKSTPRNSLTMKRRESADRLEGLRQSLGRRSADVARPSQAAGIASWLQRRRTEEFATPRSSVDLLRTPRQSLSKRPSFEAVDKRVDEGVAANDAAIFEKCFQHIDDFATEGLRTLLYGYRYIDEDTYSEWKAQYREAETSLVDRQERIEEAGDLIEHKFELAGATAIEDKLQDGVPETIDKFGRANVKVWMLTGDKRETAINIGHSARVCKPFSEVYVLDAAAPGSLLGTLTVTLNDVSRGMAPHTVLVVDGQTLAKIDADDDLAILFYDLVVRVDSVICCRASPSQKAELVKSIRRYVPKSMTLAIGDGANDIGMIQASHVGIGISGREGLQAARISDYSIAQFRFLQKLLFVHGRWNYLRTGKYVLATFWKEIVFYLVQAHYQRMNGYTGTSLFESWSLTLFNSAFTSLPVILLGIFERDLRPETLLAVPELYTFGQRDMGFNYKQYIGWMLMGVSSSFIVFYFMESVYNTALFTEDTAMYAVGTICFTVGVILINVKLLILELHSKTVITFGGFIISIGGWFLWCVALSGVYPSDFAIYNVRNSFVDNFGRRLLWWATLLLTLVTPIIIELVVQSIRRVYWPTDQDLMQRIEQDSDSKRLLQQVAQDAEIQEGAGIEAASGGAAFPGAAEPDNRGRDELPLALRSREQSRSPTPRRTRLSHDEFRRRQFTPPSEERDDPFNHL